MRSRLASTWVGGVALVLLIGCGDANPDSAVAGPQASEPGSDTPHEETRRMARRLDLILSNSSLQDSFFRNDEKLESLRSMAPPDDPDDRARAELAIAVEALRAGESKEAAAGLTALLDRVLADPEAFPVGLERRVRRQLAVAHLRVGEQENCLDGHHAEACLLPIQGGGVHRREAGSRAALAELALLLADEPEDLTLRWLYNLASMTLGEYPDGVPETWRIAPEVFEAEAPFPRFAEVAPGAGLDTITLAGGVVVDDLDGDGHLDVAVSSWGARDPLRIFLARPREGRLVYEEHTQAGVDGLTGGLNLTHADYDNDGDLDLFVLRGAWQYDQGHHPNSLLRNDGAAGFEDVTESAGLLSFHPTQTAAWADYDNDGWLDLFIGNESAGRMHHPCELYRNLGPDADGRVTFREVAVEAGVAATDYVKGVAWGDIDNDGWPDLYLSSIRGPNRLYRNLGGDAEGIVRFEEIAAQAGVDEPVDSFPTWFFDADNDGDHDLFVADYGTDFREARATSVLAGMLGQPFESSVSRLYRNRGDGRFEDVAAGTRLALPMLVMGANFGDLDNDGWPDLYLGTGAPDYQALIPNRMFRNVDGGRFEDVTTSGGFGHLQKGHGIAFADLDHDGDQDVLAVMGGAFSGDVYPNALFENPGAPGRWITLRLEGVLGNRSAIGARIRVDLETPSGGRSVHATVSSGGSFGGSSLQQEIGLGGATAIRRLVVRWPGGVEQTFDEVPMDRTLRLVEGDPRPTEVALDPLRLEAGGAPGHHHGSG